MATTRAAYVAEQAVGHDGSAITQQDVAAYDGETGKDATMKALCWMGKNKVEIHDMPQPKILESQDVILKVTGSTVCGSDLHLLHGVVPEMKSHDILGHEFCGVAYELGSDVKKVQKGKRYVASFQFACGDCYFCENKLSSQCEKTNSNQVMKSMYGGQTAGMFGYGHITSGTAGGQAEYVRVPIGDVNLLEIPDDVPDEKALYLSDVLATSYNAVFDTKVYEKDQVAIWGMGPIGQFAAIFALREGASKVICIDTEPRLSYIKEHWPKEHADKLEMIDYKQYSFGVTTKPTVVSRLKELCGGRGPDVCLECAAGEYAKGWYHWIQMQLGLEQDTSEIINEMIEGCRNFGRCGLTGIYLGYTNSLAIGSLMERGIRLIGNGQAPVHKYWEDLLEMIRKKEIEPLDMVSHRVRLEDLDKVYYMFEKREESMQKVYVETQFSAPACEGCPALKRY